MTEQKFASKIFNISIFDMLGRTVAILAHGSYEPVRHRVIFDASGLFSGIYYSRMEVGMFKDIRKMLFNR